MGGCAAANCHNSHRKGFRMHQFPADPHRRLKWTISCRRSGWTPGPRAELCHVHFENSQYEQNRADNLKRLKPNAVPTLFESPHAPAVFTSRGVKGRGSVTMNPVLHSSPLDRTEVSNDELLLRICELEEELIALKLENADLKAANEKLKTDIEANKNDLSFLSKEQLYVANKKLLKHAWSSESIIKGLKLRFALGKFGYKFLLSTGYPAPSYSTLKRNIRGIPMEFGVLHGILDSLKTKVDAMEPARLPAPEPVRERRKETKNTRCAAVICMNSDSMAITNGVRTVTIDSPSNGEVAKELVDFNVRYLTLVDEKTEKRWMDIAKSGLVKNIKVTRCKPFDMKPCDNCKRDDCRLWKAAAVITRVYRLPFNPLNCLKNIQSPK